MKFTATAVVVAIAASFGINPVRGELFDGDGKSGKQSPSASLDEFRYTEPANFAGDYTQCSVSVIHSSASGILDNTYHGCAENASPVVFTVTKTDEFGAYKATTMPPEFVLSDDFAMGGWQGFAKGNTLLMSSFGEATLSIFPDRVVKSVIYNNSPNTMTCSAFKKGVMECMAVFTEYCSEVSDQDELANPYCENKEGDWLNTYSMRSVFVREGFSCPSSPPGFCESTPLLRNPISEDTVAAECGGSYSGNIVVSLKKDLNCNKDNTISGPDAAFTLTNGATLDCEGHELSMGDDVDIRYGIKMFNTATVRNCNVSKFRFANAEIKFPSESGTTKTIINSSFNESRDGDGVHVEKDNWGDLTNNIVLKDVTASSNYDYGLNIGGAVIKLEGNVRANDNGNMGIGFAYYNKIEVIGQVEVRNNAYGLYVFYPSSGYLTLIGDATFTACGNTYYDMSRYGGAEVLPQNNGEYFCQTQDTNNGQTTLPICGPCS